MTGFIPKGARLYWKKRKTEEIIKKTFGERKKNPERKTTVAKGINSKSQRKRPRWARWIHAWRHSSWWRFWWPVSPFSCPMSCGLWSKPPLGLNHSSHPSIHVARDPTGLPLAVVWDVGGRGWFLDAPSHLYMRLCPSVRPSVCPSVRMSRVIFEGEKNAY